MPDPSTTESFILEVQRGLDGSRLKFDLEDYGDLPAAPSSQWICHARRRFLVCLCCFGGFFLGANRLWVGDVAGFVEETRCWGCTTMVGSVIADVVCQIRTATWQLRKSLHRGKMVTNLVFRKIQKKKKTAEFQDNSFVLKTLHNCVTTQNSQQKKDKFLNSIFGISAVLFFFVFHYFHLRFVSQSSSPQLRPWGGVFQHGSMYHRGGVCRTVRHHPSLCFGSVGAAQFGVLLSGHVFGKSWRVVLVLKNIWHYFMDVFTFVTSTELK